MLACLPDCLRKECVTLNVAHLNVHILRKHTHIHTITGYNLLVNVKALYDFPYVVCPIGLIPNSFFANCVQTLIKTFVNLIFVVVWRKKKRLIAYDNDHKYFDFLIYLTHNNKIKFKWWRAFWKKTEVRTNVLRSLRVYRW